MTPKPKKESPSKKKQVPSTTIRMEARKQSAYGWKHQKQKEKKQASYPIDAQLLQEEN